LFGFAPGYYIFRCRDAGQQFHRNVAGGNLHAAGSAFSAKKNPTENGNVLPPPYPGIAAGTM
jgi:hypothetical protein